MKILSRDNIPEFDKTLKDTLPGDCIQFKVVPHQKHAADSLFMVLRVPAQYTVEAERAPNGIFRIMVANVDTGACSLVAQTRAVRFVNVEVQKL